MFSFKVPLTKDDLRPQSANVGWGLLYKKGGDAHRTSSGLKSLALVPLRVFKAKYLYFIQHGTFTEGCHGQLNDISYKHRLI